MLDVVKVFINSGSVVDSSSPWSLSGLVILCRRRATMAEGSAYGRQRAMSRHARCSPAIPREAWVRRVRMVILAVVTGRGLLQHRAAPQAARRRRRFDGLRKLALIMGELRRTLTFRCRRSGFDVNAIISIHGAASSIIGHNLIARKPVRAPATEDHAAASNRMHKHVVPDRWSIGGYKFPRASSLEMGYGDL